MTEIIKIDSIEKASRLYTGKSVSNPLVHVMNLADLRVGNDLMNKRLCVNLYRIAVGKQVNPDIKHVRYGRNYYDFCTGSITAYGPDQVVVINQECKAGDIEGHTLMFHPDLIKGHALEQKIKTFGFFSYDTTKALNITQEEKETILDLMRQLKNELQQSRDEFRKDLVLAYVELLLDYIHFYYNRQYKDQEHQAFENTTQFIKLIDEHIENQYTASKGMLTVSSIF